MVPKKVINIVVIAIMLLEVLALKQALASTTLKVQLDQAINNSILGKTATVAASVRDAKTGKLLYEKYGNYLLHTASVLKAFSMPVVLEYLGTDSTISTKVFKSPSDNNIYIKLSGDPFLTSQNLVELFKLVKEKGISEIKGSILIDDSIIDNIPWGVGWMWDDENNELMPKYSAYNLDHNLITVKVLPQKINTPPIITLVPNYTVKIINYAISSNINDLTIERRPWEDPENIYISGKIATTVQKQIPVGKPDKYFISRLKNAIEANKIIFRGKVESGLLPSNVQLIAEMKHPLLEIVSYTNQKSDNLAAETLLKLAGGKYSHSKGSTKNGLMAFNNFYTKLAADPASQQIVDASGASHNDLVQPNWMTLALAKLFNHSKYHTYLNTLAQPGKRGTLQNRFRGLAGRLWGKTGTLAGISSIVGYLKSRSGKMYSFAIVIQNYKGSSTPAKTLEDKIIQIIDNYSDAESK